MKTAIIYYSKFDKRVLEYAKNHTPNDTEIKNAVSFYKKLK